MVTIPHVERICQTLSTCIGVYRSNDPSGFNSGQFKAENAAKDHRIQALEIENEAIKSKVPIIYLIVLMLCQN
jgi:hypothetical protein